MRYIYLHFIYLLTIRLNNENVTLCLSQIIKLIIKLIIIIKVIIAKRLSVVILSTLTAALDIKLTSLFMCGPQYQASQSTVHTDWHIM